MADIIPVNSYVDPISLITPAVPPNSDIHPSPATWLVVLSGVAVAEFTAVPGTEYTILVNPDVSGPVNWAVTHYPADPAPVVLQGPKAVPALNLLQWAPYAAVGSVFDKSTGNYFDVRAFQPGPFLTETDATTGRVMNQIFAGFYVGITAYGGNVNAWTTFRLPYNFTLLAQIGWVIPIE